MMIYLLGHDNDESFTIFYQYDAIPEHLRAEIFEVEHLPDGDGILKRKEDGTFYYEPFTEVESPELDEQEPSDTLGQRLDRIEQTTAYTQLQIEYLAMLAESN